MSTWIFLTSVSFALRITGENYSLIGIKSIKKSRLDEFENASMRKKGGTSFFIGLHLDSYAKGISQDLKAYVVNVFRWRNQRTLTRLFNGFRCRPNRALCSCPTLSDRHAETDDCTVVPYCSTVKVYVTALVPFTTIKGLPGGVVVSLVNGTPVMVTPLARLLFGSNDRVLGGFVVKSVMIKFVVSVTLEYSKLSIFSVESLYTSNCG